MTDLALSLPASTLPAATSTRPRRLRWLDRTLEASWAAGLTTRPSLEPADLIAGVQGAHSVADRCGWRARLHILCEDLALAHLAPLGRVLAHGQITAALAHRVRAEALWARHPDILDRPVVAPIFVVGQMRSGSTRLQRLLAADPRLTATRFFESWNPVPRGAPGAAFDDRRWRGRAALAVSRLLNPQFAGIHPTSWDAPDEEIGWHSIAFFGASFEAQWRVPRFAAAVEQGDAVPVYQEFRRYLQTVAWLRGEPTHRRWVLKVPQFTQDLAAIETVFPDATLICLHRDPVAVVASSASLVSNQVAVQSDAAHHGWIGRETLRKVALRHRRTEAALRRTRLPTVDIDYAATDADWAGEMQRVYQTLRMPFTADTRAAMAAYLIRAERHRSNLHRYALADFGLDAQGVRAALAGSDARQ